MGNHDVEKASKQIPIPRLLAMIHQCTLSSAESKKGILSWLEQRSRLFQRREFNHVIISWNGIFPGN
jgi:hypothetical protein